MTEEQTVMFGPGIRSRCVECGRALSNPKSRERGMGPICAGRVGARETSEPTRSFFLYEPEIREAVVMKRIEGHAYTNVPRVVTHHSPTGYEWGYGGSGPADLALNICEIAVAHVLPGADHDAVELYGGRCSREAWGMYQDFKSEFVAGAPSEGGRIPWEEVEAWVRGRLEA